MWQQIGTLRWAHVLVWQTYLQPCNATVSTPAEKAEWIQRVLRDLEKESLSWNSEPRNNWSGCWRRLQLVTHHHLHSITILHFLIKKKKQTLLTNCSINNYYSNDWCQTAVKWLSFPQESEWLVSWQSWEHQCAHHHSNHHTWYQVIVKVHCKQVKLLGGQHPGKIHICKVRGQRLEVKCNIMATRGSIPSPQAKTRQVDSRPLGVVNMRLSPSTVWL